MEPFNASMSGKYSSVVPTTAALIALNDSMKSFRKISANSGSDLAFDLFIYFMYHPPFRIGISLVLDVGEVVLRCGDTTYILFKIKIIRHMRYDFFH